MDITDSPFFPPGKTPTAFGSHFNHLLTCPGSTSVHEELHLAKEKFSNGHVKFLDISTERNTDKKFSQTIILHQALKQKEFRKFDYCSC